MAPQQASAVEDADSDLASHWRERPQLKRCSGDIKRKKLKLHLLA